MKLSRLEFPIKNGHDIYAQYKSLSSIALKMRTAGWRVDQEAVEKHRKTAEARKKRFTELWTEMTGVKELGKNGATTEVKAWFWETKKVDQRISIDKNTGQPKLDTNGCLMTLLTTSDDPAIRDAAAALIGIRKAAKTLEFCQEYDKPRVHATFNVTGTKGARWSCNRPNIQQLPSKEVKYEFSTGIETLAVSLKNILVADPGFILVGADYSALELYLQTYQAGAKKLLDWISRGKDLHLGNARAVYPYIPEAEDEGPLKKKYKKERTVAKFFFGLAYCASDHVGTTAKQMRAVDPDITDALVKEMRTRYFTANPEFPEQQQRTIKSVHERGYVEIPPFGRRLYLEDSMRGHNQALNSGPQNLGGDVCNMAVIEIERELDWSKGQALRAQVHDSIILQVEDTPQAREYWPHRLEKAMAEQPVFVNGVQVKLVAEAAVGPNFQSV